MNTFPKVSDDASVATKKTHTTRNTAYAEAKIVSSISIFLHKQTNFKISEALNDTKSSIYNIRRLQTPQIM